MNNDLSIYNEARWWDFENSSFVILHRMNNVRIPYFVDKGILNVSRPVIVDVGCGGGLVTESVAKLVPRGSVVGIDISEPSLGIARAHAKSQGVKNLIYKIGSIYEIPIESSSADLVIVSDVLEHLENVDDAILEVYRILKPGGIFVFDTIARSWWSFLSTYFVAQEVLGLVEPRAHDWFMFINPEELEKELVHAGFKTDRNEWRGIVGDLDFFGALRSKNLYNLIPSFSNSKDDLSTSYMGYAIKP